MSFEDSCVCHVWAIDGYAGDALARNMGRLYEDEGTRLLISKSNLLGNLDGVVAHLVEHSRTAQATVAHCTIYGGFQRAKEGAPEHMWLEYDGYVYDTMPGAPLRRVAAAGRQCWPPSEQSAFNTNKVGKVDSVLTTQQFWMIQNATWKRNSKMNCDEYLPPSRP